MFLERTKDGRCHHWDFPLPFADPPGLGCLANPVGRSAHGLSSKFVARRRAAGDRNWKSEKNMKKYPVGCVCKCFFSECCTILYSFISLSHPAEHSCVRWDILVVCLVNLLGTPQAIWGFTTLPTQAKVEIL